MKHKNTMKAHNKSAEFGCTNTKQTNKRVPSQTHKIP